MQRFHIIGGKNHGKTTLVADLLRELTGRGLRVGTIKHTHHQHELDTPGKDSHIHREAGASVVGILTPQLDALFLTNDDSAAKEDRYTRLMAAMTGCDLVIVEGDTQATAPQLEVWRASMGTPPMCADAATNIRAVISDDLLDVEIPILARSDVPAIADWILSQAD
ncbi:MAG: molybdopterin-guanine dinucleotide biosynthesis protein B [Planctomycetaceae bacterium]|nr:molybdopterin-guanine dinucleotide biosynthesis protein B [Planctomycetaceae bacterium]MCB9950100.1 molybdopterin-guanine dinucleotide biosynthesis protein B [Planctomycetaceae bacterium]